MHAITSKQVTIELTSADLQKPGVLDLIINRIFYVHKLKHVRKSKNVYLSKERIEIWLGVWCARLCVVYKAETNELTWTLYTNV